MVVVPTCRSIQTDVEVRHDKYPVPDLGDCYLDQGQFRVGRVEAQAGTQRPPAPHSTSVVVVYWRRHTSTPSRERIPRSLEGTIRPQ